MTCPRCKATILWSDRLSRFICHSCHEQYIVLDQDVPFHDDETALSTGEVIRPMNTEGQRCENCDTPLLEEEQDQLICDRCISDMEKAGEEWMRLDEAVWQALAQPEKTVYRVYELPEGTGLTDQVGKDLGEFLRENRDKNIIIHISRVLPEQQQNAAGGLRPDGR